MIGSNDHGVGHAWIVGGKRPRTLRPPRRGGGATVQDGSGDLEDTKVIVLCGAYRHNLGIAIHHTSHLVHAGTLVNPSLTPLLPPIHKNLTKRIPGQIRDPLYDHYL